MKYETSTRPSFPYHLANSCKVQADKGVPLKAGIFLNLHHFELKSKKSPKMGQITL